jgi:hypothetical protein
MSSADEPSERERNAEEPVELLRGGRLYQRLFLDPMGEAPERPPVRRALLFAALAWLPLAVLAAVAGEFLAGDSGSLAFTRDLTVHIRLLLALPVLLLVEPFVRARLELVVRYLGKSDLIAADEKPRWEAALETARRRRDSVVLEVLLLVAALALSIWGTFGDTLDVRSGLRMGAWRWESGGAPSLAGWWYALVSGPIVLYHVLRWLLRIGLWALLLRSAGWGCSPSPRPRSPPSSRRSPS